MTFSDGLIISAKAANIRDICTIFGNTLDNAIECKKRFPIRKKG
ncbi:GHKL domain-containing protein [Kineothrix alysoides]